LWSRRSPVRIRSSTLTAQKSNVSPGLEFTSGRESCDDFLQMTGCDTSWKAMLGKGERDATEEEIAALEAVNGPFLPADGEG